MTIAEKIDYLNSTKTAIREAIVDKGGVVADGASYRDYAESIATIPQGTIKRDFQIRFFDYDGTPLSDFWVDAGTSLTANDFPPIPTHEGMVFQEWNATVEDLANIQRDYDIGPSYDTDDGGIHFFFGHYNNQVMYVCAYILEGNGNVYYSVNDGNKSNVSKGSSWTAISVPIGYSVVRIWADAGVKFTIYGRSSSYPIIANNINLAECRIGSSCIRMFDNYAALTAPPVISIHKDFIDGKKLEAIPSLTCIVVPRMQGWRSESTSYESAPLQIIGGASSWVPPDLSERSPMGEKVILANSYSNTTDFRFGAWDTRRVFIDASAGITSIGFYSYDVYWGATMSSTSPPPVLLQELVIKNETPPTIPLNNTKFLASCYRRLHIFVPDSSVDAYKAAWTDFADKIHPLSERRNY